MWSTRTQRLGEPRGEGREAARCPHLSRIRAPACAPGSRVGALTAANGGNSVLHASGASHAGHSRRAQPAPAEARRRPGTSQPFPPVAWPPPRPPRPPGAGRVSSGARTSPGSPPPAPARALPSREGRARHLVAALSTCPGRAADAPASPDDRRSSRVTCPRLPAGHMSAPPSRGQGCCGGWGAWVKGASGGGKNRLRKRRCPLATRPLLPLQTPSLCIPKPHPSLAKPRCMHFGEL